MNAVATADTKRMTALGRYARPTENPATSENARISNAEIHVAPRCVQGARMAASRGNPDASVTAQRSPTTHGPFTSASVRVDGTGAAAPKPVPEEVSRL